MQENKNIRVREILRRNFYRITELKNKGYSWREILNELGLKPSRKFEIKCSIQHAAIARKITPNAKSFNRFNQGIRIYVKKNIERFITLRASGFNWDEILEKLRLRSRFPLSRNIKSSVQRYFTEANGRNCRK